MRVFYDLTCPFCYLAQPFNKRLLASGTKLIELPFQAHPETPAEGMYMGPRRGLMYDDIAARAKAENLPLKWRDTLPNSRLALAAAEWVRQSKPEAADKVREGLFHVHFAEGKDIGNLEVVLSVLEQCGVDGKAVEAGLASGTAMNWVDDAEQLGRERGVRSTPTWESNGQLVAGLRELEVKRLSQI